MEAKLPIIDLETYRIEGRDTSETAKSIREACKNVGFFYVKNHGVPEEIIQSLFSSAATFMNLSLEEKKEIRL